MVPRTPSSPWMDVDPQTQQTLLVKPLLSQSTPTHLFFSSHSCCLLRGALSTQSDRSSGIVITVSTTCFHRVWVSLPWSYPHPVSHFSQQRWDAPPQERRLSYILCDPRINVRMLYRNSRNLPPTYRCGTRKGVHFRLPHL